MSKKPVSNERVLNNAKRSIVKLQKEGLSPALIEAELAQKGIDPRTTARLIQEIRSDGIAEYLRFSVSALAIGIVMAGFSLGAQQGWIDFDFLSERRIIILIISGLVGVLMIALGVWGLIETMFKAMKK